MKRQSLFIEPDGATPIDDASGLIPTNIRTRRQLNEAEARNISKAFAKYLASVPSKRRAPFTLEWVYKLHAEMFGEVWQWAGERRKTGLNLGVPIYQIGPDLKDLLDDLAVWRERGTVRLVEQSARLHHRAVKIHPFPNGNGRWARLLANIWLKRFRSDPVDWPEKQVGNRGGIRAEYIAALKTADDGNYAPLMSLHERYSARHQ